MTEALPPGTTIKLGELIRLIEHKAKDTREETNIRRRRGYSRDSISLPGELDTTARAFHQNQCWNARHNCEKCKADCSDRRES